MCTSLVLVLVIAGCFTNVVSRASNITQQSCLHIPLRLDQKAAFRYRHNIHHQSEFIYPAVDAILTLMRENDTLVHTVVMELKLLRWSRAVLHLAQPHLHIVAYNWSIVKPLDPADSLDVQKRCGGPLVEAAISRRVNLSCSTYFHHNQSFGVLQQRAGARCGLSLPRRCDSFGGRKRIGILNRHTNRRIADADRLAAALSNHYGEGVDVVVRTTSDNAQLCDQVAWFSDVDVIIVAHGQTETNSIFLPQGTAMVEVLPWSLPSYCTYRSAMDGSGVRIEQIIARRHPADVFDGFQAGIYTQAECRADHACYVWHRDRPTMDVAPEQVIEAIEAAGGLQRVCQQQEPQVELQQQHLQQQM